MTKTMTTTADKRAAFRKLHEQGCFVLPNPWDAGSARLLEHVGFAALATTSAGFAWSTGRPDYGIRRDDVLAHLRAMCAATSLPVNADFEGGFALEPAGVADNVRLALDTGVAGLSIEDRTDDKTEVLERGLAVERIRAARAAIGDTGAVLVARAEILLFDPAKVTPAIDALVAFAAAGADCLFAPGLREPADIAAAVRAVAPKPLNMVVFKPGVTVPQLAELGVRRISIGGGLARIAYGAALAAARRMLGGAFDDVAAGVPGAELNSIFRGA